MVDRASATTGDEAPERTTPPRRGGVRPRAPHAIAAGRRAVPPLPAADEVRHLFDQLPLSLAGQVVAAAVLWWLVRPGPGERGPTPALAWFGVFGLAWLLRLALRVAQRRQVTADLAGWMRWRWRWRASSLLLAIVWASAWPLFGGSAHGAGLLALSVLAASLCLGSGASGTVFSLGLATVVGAPMLVRIWSGGWPAMTDEAAWIERLVPTGMILGAMLAGHHHRRSFRRMLAFKHRSDLLAAQLAAEKDAAEEARLEAEAATRARTQFFTAASHDLRQPLHAMVLFTESLRQRNRDPALDPTLSSIVGSVHALETLFDKLLDLTRIDSGSVVVERRTFRLREIYARLRLHFEPLAFDKGLSLDFRGGRHLVLADELLVERVLRNLVSNAIRYTADGGVLVSGRTVTGRAGERWLQVQVWDTGIGIDEATLPRVFDEFYQVHPPGEGEDRPRKGLGLGLAIVKRLCDLMGAPLAVRSTPGRGTVFTLRLPLAPPGAVEVPPRATGPVWTGPTLQGRLVLAIGPTLCGCEEVTARLRDWEMGVQAFEALPQALSWASSQARVPDLLVVEAGGVAPEAVPALRAVFGEAVPVLCVADDEAGIAALAGLADLHGLVRPVAPNRLRAMVGFKLGQHGADGPAA